MKRIIIIFIAVIAVAFTTEAQQKKYTQYVNTFIGTAADGNTYPGAVLPFGMVQLSPDTRDNNCSGYYYPDKTIMGFSHDHLSGTGGGDFGDLLIMPTIGKLLVTPGTADDPGAGFRSRFRHSTEKASPGYYSVMLDDYGIKAELTATERAGIHRYTFPESENANIILDLVHGIQLVGIREANIKIVNNTEIEGYRRVRGWGEDRYFYFVAEFSKPFKNSGIVENGKIVEGKKEASGTNLRAYVRYTTKKDDPILIKVGISAVSIEGARKNLKAEIPGWNFNGIKNSADRIWNNHLSKIEVEGGTHDQKEIFYTSIYHALLCPSLYGDVDGKYRGMDRKVHQSDDFRNYTVYSLWDTFRAAHPLFTLIEPERDAEFIRNLIAKYREGGILPIWPLAGNYTKTMIGYHAIPVIVDAYNKGIRNYNIAEAYKAMLYSADRDHLGLKYYKGWGYIPADKEIESVSKTLEYAYDDWCISQMADSLGKKNDYNRFIRRSRFYKNLYDPKTGFMRAKKANGSWVTPFDPFVGNHNYTESNAWQYNMFVPQDMKGLIALHGGKKKFIADMDKLFTAKKKSKGKNLNFLTGMIGQYAQGNEPSHHMAYLYNYAGAPWKTQKYAREIMDRFYTTKPDGLIGNEDCGQMSSWYVFSAMGFYPVCPGDNQYITGTPIFNCITINMDNGKKFLIEAINVSDKNIYINSAKYNGTDCTKSYLTHGQITTGGKIVYAMTNTPNREWGSKNSDLPGCPPAGPFVRIPNPAKDIENFTGSVSVSLECPTKGAEIYYTIDGSNPTKSSKLFAEPFTITKTTQVKARAYKSGMKPSAIMTIESKNLPANPPQHTGNLEHGIKYSYYDGGFKSVNDMLKIKPIKSGVISNFSMAPRDQEDYFGFIYNGYVKVPVDGIYSFYTISDDGSTLYLDGKQLLDNDGSHGSKMASGVVALKAGFHKIKVMYYEDYEGQFLEVGMEGPGIKKQPIPKSVLYYEK